MTMPDATAAPCEHACTNTGTDTSTDASTARLHLILGGQKSGKSAYAERAAAHWLARSTTHRALLLATAQAADDEMRARIARHQQQRALRVPGLHTLEVPTHLPTAIRQHSQAHTLLVVDCLTLWLTQILMPPPAAPHANTAASTSSTGVAAACAAMDELATALSACCGHVLLVSNEIGLGVIPLGRETRQFVDMLGQLNQRIARICQQVTFMAAGLPLHLKTPTPDFSPT